ncbi:hypothetical protein K474DRAFT_866701 [Panus rudis PR-1116 ss-1]|nr:hypothetical protein K474DRAFT_866701 [Panus rudis PR-1116 ss-1]
MRSSICGPRRGLLARFMYSRCSGSSGVVKFQCAHNKGTLSTYQPLGGSSCRLPDNKPIVSARSFGHRPAQSCVALPPPAVNFRVVRLGTREMNGRMSSHNRPMNFLHSLAVCVVCTLHSTADAACMLSSSLSRQCFRSSPSHLQTEADTR